MDTELFGESQQKYLGQGVKAGLEHISRFRTSPAHVYSRVTLKRTEY